MKPTFKKNQAITIHRDGTISYFSIAQQTWKREQAEWIAHSFVDYAALTFDDHRKILRAITRLSCRNS